MPLILTLLMLMIFGICGGYDPKGEEGRRG